MPGFTANGSGNIALECEGDNGATAFKATSDTSECIFAQSNSNTAVAAVSIAGYGVTGSSSSGTGVFGGSISNTGVAGASTTNTGVAGQSQDGTGVAGISLGNGPGVSGQSQNGPGVAGISLSLENNPGLSGQSNYGPGVLATSTNGAAGVFEINNDNNASSALIVGTVGNGNGISSYSQGGDGISSLSETHTGVSGVGINGIEGSSTGTTGASILGHTPASGQGFAGKFLGNVDVQGTLTKSAGTFKIDHPLDPAQKYLAHAFVEAAEMKNLYDGMVLLDDTGEAVVELPDWFEALNTAFRYQLTCIGGYAPVYIAQKIQNHRFKIAGGKPGMEVSWLVTGIRHDPYALAHAITVEEEKSEQERGYYRHPELYGEPEERGIAWVQFSESMQRLKQISKQR